MISCDLRCRQTLYKCLQSNPSQLPPMLWRQHLSLVRSYIQPLFLLSKYVDANMMSQLDSHNVHTNCWCICDIRSYWWDYKSVGISNIGAERHCFLPCQSKMCQSHPGHHTNFHVHIDTCLQSGVPFPS